MLPLNDGRLYALFRVPSVDGRFVTALFDPATSRWSAAPTPAFPPLGVIRLTDGQLLALGASPGGGLDAPALVAPTAALYDPARGQWTTLASPSASGPLAPLPDGRALLLSDGGAEVLGDLSRPRACFAETGRCLSGRILDYWQATGGLVANGFPLTNPLTEILEDGRSYTVQYFERVRLEQHPENAPPHDFLLGQFGRRIRPADPPASSLAGQRYFPESGHNLGGRYRDYWEANGGLPRFGYPLSEIITETLENGRSYAVQYFERARLEYHPENSPPYDILVGQFGRQILQENTWLDEEPAFKALYVTNPKAQAALGPPRGPITRGDLEYQGFERGVALLPIAFDAVYVLCDGSPAAGPRAFTAARRSEAPPQQIPAPEPGLYKPALGIGELWGRDVTVRACLGYATEPGATGSYRAARAFFARGLLVAAMTPDGPVIYALYGVPDGTGHLTDGSYERFSVRVP